MVIRFTDQTPPGLRDDLTRLFDYAQSISKEEAMQIFHKHHTGVQLFCHESLTAGQARGVVGNILRQRITPAILERDAGPDFIKLPADINYVIVGHGRGVGDNWVLEDGIRVQDKVNEIVPPGQTAWCVVCETDHARHIERLEGVRMISRGPISSRTGPSKIRFGSSASNAPPDGEKPASKIRIVHRPDNTTHRE